MKTFMLEILTPEKPFFRGSCVSIMVPTSEGMMGIMAGRSPLTAAVTDGPITFSGEDGEKKICAVTRGMVSVSSKRVRILCESAVYPEEIDAEKERLKMQEAELEMRKRLSYEEYMVSKLAFAKAFNRLKVKQYSAMQTNM